MQHFISGSSLVLLSLTHCTLRRKKNSDFQICVDHIQTLICGPFFRSITLSPDLPEEEYMRPHWHLFSFPFLQYYNEKKVMGIPCTSDYQTHGGIPSMTSWLRAIFF